MLKTRHRFATLLLFIFFGGCGTPQPPKNSINPSTFFAQNPVESSQAYHIQPGDLLDIKLYYHSDLNDEVTVRPDGQITMQLVDDVKAENRTPEELDEELIKQFAKFVKDPVVTVIVSKYVPSKVYIGGEVGNPGQLILSGNLTVLQAIIQSGGFRVTSEPRSDVIIREQRNAKPAFIVTNLDEGLKNTSYENDLLLQPKDVVFVPKSLISEANTFVDQYIEQILPFSRSVNANYNWGKNDY
jgi:polysaccharide export outer membrane protein